MPLVQKNPAVVHRAKVLWLELIHCVALFDDI